MVNDIFKNDPQLYRLHQILHSLFRAESEPNVIDTLMAFNESITVENLLLISELCYQLRAHGSKSGNIFLHHIYELFRNILKAAQENKEDVKTMISRLASDEFHPNSRIEQVQFQRSLRYIIANSNKIEKTKVESVLTSWLLTWCWLGHPQLTIDHQEAFSMLNRIADRGPFSLFKNSAISKLDVIRVIIRSLLKSDTQKKLVSRYLQFVVLLLFMFISVGAAYYLLTYLIFPSSETLGIWKYVISAFVYIVTIFVLTLIPAYISYLNYKRAGVLGVTIGSGESSQILIDPAIPPDKFKRTVRHEITHKLKEMGLIKRDLATLVEAHGEWKDNSLVLQREF